MNKRDIPLQGHKVDEKQTRDVPYKGLLKRGGYAHGARRQTFERPHVLNSQPQRAAIPLAGSKAFTGRGFLPDLFTSHAPVTLAEASASYLENEGVHGREGMMPPAGSLGRMQAGQRTDEGAGGAGSFATAIAFGAKVNG